MSWFYFALLAPFLWAIVNLIDDSLLRNVYRSATFGAVVSGLFGLLPGYFLFLTNEQIITEPKFVASALGAGFLTVVFYYFYFRALAAAEPSIALALFNLAPAFVPFFAWILLNEQLVLNQYIGIAVILFAALILSIIDTKRLSFSAAIFYAFLGSISFAAVSILSKYAYSGGSFREMYMWISIGLGLGGLIFLFFGNKRREIKRILKKSKKKILLVLVGAEFINILAELTQGYAISGGPISVVRAMEGIQPIYILLIGVLFSPFFPKLFREVVDKRFPKKIFWMLLMLPGLILIYSGI